MNLSDAQAARRARVSASHDTDIDRALDHFGLSVERVERICLGTANVSPSDREKLKGIISRLRRQKHTFTTCMNSLRRNKPEWSEERRKRTCAVLKALAKPGSKGSAKLGDGCPVLELSDGVLELLSRAEVSS